MIKGIFLVFLLLLMAGCWSSESNTNSVAAEPAQEVTAPVTGEYASAQQALDDGKRLLDINQTEKAVEAFNRAIEIDPDFAEAYLQLGIAYALIENEQRGALVPGETPEPDPNASKTRRRRDEDANKPNSVKAFEKAVDAYERLIKKNDEDDVSYFNLGRALNKLNEDEDAEKAFEKAVDLRPDNAEYLIELGAIRIKLAQYRKAIEPLKKALEIDPENPEASELLEDAEAGRRRVEYSQPKKDSDKDKSNSDIASPRRPLPTPAGSNSNRAQPRQSVAPAANKP